MENKPYGLSTHTYSFSQQLDVDFLQSIYEDDFAYAKEVFNNFISETKTELSQIQVHFANGDLKAIRTALHKAKPTYSLVGFTAMTEGAESLIKKCDNATAVGDIETEFEAFAEKIQTAIEMINIEITQMKNCGI